MRTALPWWARPRAVVALLVLLGGFLAPALPARAADECEGAPPDNPCVTVNSGTIQLRPDGNESHGLYCPADYPWELGWDYTRDSSAVSVTAVSWSSGTQGIAWTAINWSPLSSHEATIYLGCVAQNADPCHFPPCPRNASERPGSPLYQPPRPTDEPRERGDEAR